jgi:hypothetical protein
MGRRGWQWRLTVLCLALIVVLAGACARPATTGGMASPPPLNERVAPGWPLRPSNAAIHEAFGRLPLHFEVNRGQTDPRVKFLARGPGYGVFLTRSEVVLGLRDGSVRMSLAGARPNPAIEGVDELPGRINYLVGRDAARWRTGVPTYSKVKYGAVYPGIDLILYGSQRQLEYDFVVAPGADPDRIRLRFRGVEALELGADGDLVVTTTAGKVVHRRPVIYQERDGVRELVDGGYVVNGRDQIAFRVGDYDRSRALVIDPVVSYATLLGGSATDAATGIAVDATGAAYVAGWTLSSNFPVANAAQPTPGGSSPGSIGDAFVAKLDAAGSALVYSTYLGGSAEDQPIGIDIDAAGHVYVAGFTSSMDFPTVNAFRPTWSDGGFWTSVAGFVAKLSPTGSALVYSTYLAGTTFAGNNSEGRCISTRINGMTVDAAGSAHVVGHTTTTDFPTTPGAFQTSTAPHSPDAQCGGVVAGFITKFAPSGNALDYSTYLDGGAGGDHVQGIALAADGNMYVTGFSFNPPFPITANLQPSGNGWGAYVLKLDASGGYIQATIVGPTMTNIAVDGAGQAHVVGAVETLQTQDFATVYAYQSAPAGDLDLVLAKLNAAGTAFVWSTYLGGSARDAAGGIVLDGDGNLWVAGETASNNFPTQDPIQPQGPGIFVLKFSPTGALTFSTPLGSGGGYGVAIDAAGDIYVAGGAGTGFAATPGAYQTTPAGGGDAFVLKLSIEIGPQPVVWTSPVKVAVDGNSITKTAGCEGCADAGAISQQTIASGDGFVEFKVSANAYLTVGLSTGNPGTSGSEIKFGLRFFPGFAVQVRESGVFKAGWTSVAGALYKIAVEGGAVKYYDNGALKYTSAQAPTYPLLVDTSLLTLGASVQNAMISTSSGGGGTLPPDPPPTVSITEPANGATVSGVVTVSANASDDVGIAKVEFLLNGSLLATDFDAPYSIQWDTTKHAETTFTLSAKATDTAGNATTSAPITVTVEHQPDTTPPTVTMVHPENGATVSGTVVVGATATDDWGIKDVRFQVDGVDIGTDSHPAYTFDWDTTTVSDGAHTLTAIATDTSGNATTSAPVTVTVANGGPPPGPQPVVWTSAVKVAVSGNTITKNAGCAGCADAGAISQQMISSGTGFVEFTVSSGATLTAGLSNGNPGTSGSEIKFGLRFYPGSPGIVEVRESGVYKWDFQHVAGAVYKVSAEAGVVKYYQNGALKYTSAQAPSSPLLVDASLLTVGSAIQNAMMTASP